MNANWLTLLPILFPLSGAILGLLFRRIWRIRVALAVIFILLSFSSSIFLLNRVITSGQPVIFQVGGWSAPVGITLIADLLSASLVVMSQVIFLAGILYAMGSQDKCVRYPAFYPIFLLMSTGLSGAFLAGDLFNLFVFAELMVISASVLTAISDDQFGVEAAYKYFIISLLASIFLLFACGMLYASYGTLNLADLAQRISSKPALPLASLAMVALLAFFMVKSAVIPFHFWQPDIYTASPTPVGAVLSSVVGKLGIYGLVRMVTLLFVTEAATIRTLIIVLGCLGIILGGLSAIRTENAKRMLAYSTMSQMGFILVAVGWGTQLSMTAALIFIFNHSLIKSSLIMVTGGLASRVPEKTAAFQILSGSGENKPFISVLYLLGAISLAGIPPMNGFVSKLSFFWSGIDASAFISMAVAGIASLFTLVYMTKAFMKIWFHKSESRQPLRLTGDRLIVPAVLILFCLFLGIWATPIVQLSQAIAVWLSDPTAYILAVIGN